jgi:hypothetical protein
MKVLCPKCNATTNLRNVEKKGSELGKCSCGVLINASYEKDGGRQIWEVRMEKPASPKPKPRGDFWFWVLVFIVTAVILLLFRRVFGAQ